MIVAVIWITGAVLAIWPLAQGVITWVVGDPADEVDKVLGGFIGVLLAVLWPLFLVGWLAYKASTTIWGRFLHAD